MEVLGLGCLACFVFLVVPAVILFAVFGVILPGSRNNAQALGDAWGFQKGPRHASVNWWIGRVDGHEAGLVPVGLRTYGTRSVPKTDPGLRLLVVADREPLGAVAYRPVETPLATTSFEEAFQIEELDRIPAPVRDAMLGYVQQHHGALRIRDREGAPADLLPAAVYPDARVLVVSEYVGGTDADEARARLDALVRIAEALEQDP